MLDAGRYRAALEAFQPDWRPLFEHLTPEGVVWSDGKVEAVHTILLATGYHFQSNYLAPLLEPSETGQIQQHKGRSLIIPGLFYVGLSYQRTYASATLRGVGPDAARVVRQIQRFLRGASTKREM